MTSDALLCDETAGLVQWGVLVITGDSLTTVVGKLVVRGVVPVVAGETLVAREESLVATTNVLAAAESEAVEIMVAMESAAVEVIKGSPLDAIVGLRTTLDVSGN